MQPGCGTGWELSALRSSDYLSPGVTTLTSSGYPRPRAKAQRRRLCSRVTSSPEGCEPPQLASDNFHYQIILKQSSKCPTQEPEGLEILTVFLFFFNSFIFQSLFNSMFLTMMLFNTCQYE